MSDLYLTEQEKKFFAESEAPKEIKSFSDWSGENNASISDPQSFLDYADFMRNELGESYDAQSEIEIQNGLRQGLSTIEGMTEETIEQSLAPKESDFDTKLNVVYSSLGVNDPDRQALLDYQSSEKVLSEQPDAAEEFRLKVDSMREQAEGIVNNRLDQTKEELVFSNQLPFAFVQDEEGKRKLLISDIATDMSIQKAIKSSQFGGVSFNPEDVSVIQSNLQVIPDTGVTVYKTKELMEISKGIVELSKSDESVADYVDGTSLRMAREKDTTAESVSRAIGDTASEFLGAIGVADAEMDEKRAKVRYASLLEIDEAVEYITDKLNETGARYKPSDVRDAYEALVIQNGFSKGMFTLRAEGKEVTENIINTKLGAQINPAVFVNDELFEKSIAAHPELSDQTKKLFVESRKLVLEDQFENYNKVLEESSYADEWSEALLEGRRAGKKDADILTEFTADEEVFSELGARTGGIAASVWDSVASLVYLAPAVFGADWGKEGLQDIAKDQANRRQIAQMFGADFGVGQDVMEAIAPMLVDIGATFLLSSATAGAGGVAYLSASSGAKLTTTGMIKGITSNVLRTGSAEATESVARTALTRDLIRGSLDDAKKAIELYNNEVAQKMGLAVGTFVPAASRSSAMSYGSLYNQLKANDPNMSDEEAHDRAMGFAMTSGVVTGIITSAFSAIGRGGVEDALLKGMNFRDAKELLGSFANTAGLTNESLKSAMGQVLRDSLKKHSGQFLKTGRKVAKNAIDESLEEGIDQLVNSYVEDVALDQTTPLAEKWQQTVHAAMVGGVLGAGVPAVQAGASRIGVTPMDRAAQTYRLREQYIQDVAANLKENGSPITAAVVEQVLEQQKRAISAAPQKETEEAETPAVETVDEMGQAKAGLERAEQDLTTLLEEQEQLKAIEELDEEQMTRLGELNTLVDEKNKEIVGFGDTIQSLESKDDERVTEAPKRGLDLLKELEGADPDEVRYQIERLRMKKNLVGKAEEIPESKSYARRVSREKIQFDSAPSTSENLPIIQRKAIDLAGMGYPQDISYKQDFGLPIYTDADAATFSDYVASAAYTIYPTVKVKEPYGGSVFESSTGKEAFNPNTGKRGIVSGFIDRNGSGVFDNDPVVIAEMLRANVPVSVPKSFALSGLNPSIIVDPDNNVVDVVAPAAEGNILESKVSSLEENKELYYNNVEASRLAAIPFKSVELPAGVSRFDTTNGATSEGEFNTVAQIKNSLNAFLAELQKTGDERNIEAHSRMEPLSSVGDSEAQLQAFVDAREKFVFNARMFELRDALQQDPTDKVGKFLSRVSLKKEAAAKRVLPLISIDKAGDLSNDAIIETFVDQYAVNNPDLSGNTPPSFASVLSNSTRNFAVQKDAIENRYRGDADETLPIDGDITKISRKRSDFTNNFGRKPDGGAATPEDVAAMMVTSIDNAVEALNSDQKLRVTVEDFVTENVFDGTPQMQEVVRSLSPKDLFGFLSSWVVSSNGRVRKSVSDFVSTLESGELFRGIELRDALIATRFTTRPDGLGIANKTAVDEFQSLFADFTGELLTFEQARNTMLAIDGALRTRLSKAKITDKRRAEITQQNDAVISKLGLKSGDPESVVTALKNIAKGMGSKNEQLVAKLLLEDTNFIQNNVRFIIGGGNIDIAGKYIKAINGNHIVFINRTSGSGRGLINTLLEEYVHAFTSDTVAATDAVLAKDKNKASARRKLEKIFNSLSRKYDADVAGGGVPNSVVADGLENLDEFIAKFFLADKFQKYVKDIVGPNSFDGIIDSIVTIFPKVTPSEKSSFVAAFKDVLDLGKRGRKHTEPDAKAIGSSAADSVLFSAPVTEVVEEDVEPTISPDILEGVPDAERGLLMQGIALIRSVLPPSITVRKAEFDTGGSLAYVSKDESTVFIDRKALVNLLSNRDLDSLSTKNILGVMINEEISHIAGFNALTQEEVDNYVESLSDSDYQKIITEYTQNSPESVAEGLRSQLASEDANAVLNVKRQLAEEKLRMHLQKVTRGFTTEEDVRFWKKKPSLFAMLKRYFAGVIRRFAANRKPLGGAGGAALNKMINEMRAIEAGFVRKPNSMKFDPNNPEATYQMQVNGAKGIDDVLYSAPIGAIDHVYERESAKFNKLREEGQIIVNQDLDQFAGQSILLHQPDTAFAGEVTMDGERIVTGQGGVYYPVMFSDQNYLWASTKSAAEGLAESLNEISRQNGGKILMGLTSADVEKLFSSTSMSNGAINFFLKLTKNPRFYGLNKATFNKILVEASKVTTKKGKVFSKKLKVSDGLEKNIEEMRILLDSEQSTFDLRTEFVESLASGVASIYDVPPLTAIKKITDPKELKRIDDLKEKSFRIASLLLVGNEYANADIKKGKLSKASILQGLGDMFTEPFVKTFQQLNKKTGNIYAVLELDGEVESVRAEEHESYKYTVISKSGEKPKVHVLGNSYYWADVTVDVDTNQPVPESKHLSYYPTFGMSNTKLKLTKADEKAKEKSLPLLFSAPVSGLTGDYAPIVNLLEVSQVEVDRLGKPKNGLLNFLNRIFAGELPEAFRRVIENRNFYRTAIEDDVVKFKKAMDKIVIKTYGSFENAPTDLIATAQGYRFQSLVSDENLEQIEDAYEASLDDIDARLEAEEIDAETARDERKIALTAKTEKIDQAHAEGLKLAEEARDEALRKISLDSPEMASFIIDIRQRYIIPMQQKLIANGLDETDIGLKISSTGEVYLTRAYRMFTDSTYLDTIKEDESWPDKRDAALEFFRKQFIRDNARKIRDELRAEGTLITYQEAKQKAKRNLDRRNEINPNRSYEQEALDTFLESYSPKALKSSGSSDSGIKMAMDNLKRRKDLPKEIRDLLGEYGAETGTDLILRTYSTVANIAAQKTFLEGLKVTAEKAGLMVSAETKIATEENQKKYVEWVPVRPDNFANKADPLANMYIHPEFKESLDMTLKNSYVQEYADTSERLINGAFTLASKLSGKAMAAKTLGSIGFYFRNAIGNFIFGTSQGFLRYDKMLAGMSKASIDALLGLNGEVDPVVTELIGLGVMGDEIRAGVMRDLLNGKQTPAGIQKELENLMDKSKASKPAKFLAAIEKKAQDLSAALDAAYKVAYFQHELGYIERAAAEGGKESLYGKMSPTQRKREAARKVLMTAQSYSQAPPLVTDFTKSPLGLMFAPFLRFKAEMFRIPFNTYKLGLEELRSGDPVMRRRGIIRMGSMTGVLGILSSALPMIMASVSGVGDDENEDEAMREGLPEYLRGHTFYYFFWDGKLKSFDATYLNPFAGTVDPILRAIEKIRQGQYSEAGAAFALGYVKDQFLDTQILANAAINAANNTNQSTGKPIWNKGVDDPIDVATKLFGYVASEAYAPRIGKDFVKGLETQSLEGMLGELSKGAVPARTYDVDLQRSFERFLLDHGKRFANVKSELGKLRSSQPLSDETIREIIDDNIEARRRMNYELMRVARGFNSLGLGADKVINTMHDRGVGKQRTKLLSYGFMDRPSIKFIAESLLQERSKEFGPERLQKIVEYYRTKNRYIPVSPVTESD